MRFDYSDIPLWTMVGDGYLCLLDPLHVKTKHPIDGRAPYVKTLCQIGSKPTARHLDDRGYSLTKAMPTLAVHVQEARPEGRTSQAIDWDIDVEVHCFSDAMNRGAELRQDRTDGTRSLTQHVVEYLHMRLIPGELDVEGIEVQPITHVVTTERVDWWVVRTSVQVRQEIRRDRTSSVGSVEVRQFGKPKRDPVHTQIIDLHSIEGS